MEALDVGPVRCRALRKDQKWSFRGLQDLDRLVDRLTVQSLTNFAAMTGSITAAWNGLKTLDPQLFSGIWVPYAFAFLFGFVSILISLDGLKKDKSGKLDFGSIAGAIFIALINSIVLASAVVGASVATGSPLKT